MTNSTMLYPHPESSSIPELLLDYPNTLMNGYFGSMTLLTLWVVLFANFQLFSDTSKAFAGASFSTFIIGTFMLIMGAINLPVWFLTVLLVLVSMWVTNNENRF